MTDKVIVTNVIGINGLRAVILDKETLECLYKTNGKIQYLDKIWYMTFIMVEQHS